MNGIVKTILGFVAAGVLAAGGYFAGDLTKDEALAVTTNVTKASEACESLLKGNGFVVVAPAAESEEE